MAVLTSSPLPLALEALLIRAAQRGNFQAYSRIVLAHKPRLYNLAYKKLGGNQEKAEDVLEETILKVWAGRASFKGNYLFSFLAKALSNMINNEYTAKKNQNLSFEDLEQEDSEGVGYEFAAQQDSIFVELARSKEAEMLRKAVQELKKRDPKLGDLVLYKYFENWPNTLIAAKLSMSPGTVSSSLSRARDQLKDILSQYGINMQRPSKPKKPKKLKVIK